MRTLTVIGAFLAANLAAGVALLALLPMALKLGVPIDTGNDPIAPGAALLFGIVLPIVMIAGFSILPALLVIGYAEMGRIRSPLFYCGAGALIGVLSLALCVLVLLAAGKGDLPPAKLEWTTVALAGLVAGVLFGGLGCVGGLTYWLIAVRPISPGG